MDLFKTQKGRQKEVNMVLTGATRYSIRKRKIQINIPSNHIIDTSQVKLKLDKYKNEDYVAWIGHATFIIKLGNTTIITDPVFEKNMGPLIFGPKKICRSSY